MRSQQNAETEVNESDRFERNVSKKHSRGRLAVKNTLQAFNNCRKVSALNILQEPEVEVIIILIHIRILCISS